MPGIATSWHLQNGCPVLSLNPKKMGIVFSTVSHYHGFIFLRESKEFLLDFESSTLAIKMCAQCRCKDTDLPLPFDFWLDFFFFEIFGCRQGNVHFPSGFFDSFHFCPYYRQYFFQTEITRCMLLSRCCNCWAWSAFELQEFFVVVSAETGNIVKEVNVRTKSTPKF